MFIQRHAICVELSFDMKLPVEFRRVGTRRWLMGYTEEMSSCAVRFRAGEWVEPKSQIEMVFRMPAGDPCNLVCKGVVLRVDLPGQAGLLPTIAVTIDKYEFVRLSPLISGVR
jgi:hypothetical protein